MPLLLTYAQCANSATALSATAPITTAAILKQECGASSELWVCLICGFVGCGGRVTSGSSSSSNSHINAHHVLTLHAYALDIETQQVSL
jgi:BRCA1-associated protein